MRVSRNARGQWFYDFRYRNKRFRVITGLTKAETESALHERINKLKREFHGISSVEPEKPILFKDFAQDFLELYSRKNRRPKTVQSHKNSINHLLEAFKGKALSDISTEMIERYKSERSEKVAPASVNRELSCIKKMFNQAIRWKRVQFNPASSVEKFKEDNCRMRILSNDEISKLLEVSNERLKIILIIGLHTGMRIGEILSLQWENVHFDFRFITVQAIDAKSGKSRRVPMNSRVMKVLMALPKKNRFVFFNEKTKKNILCVRTAFVGTCRRAKINEVTFHCLRHTAATKMLEAGVDIVTVSKILGHASIEMTYNRYCHPTPENFQNAVDRLGDILAAAA